MPVQSLDSSVFTWPGRSEVHQALLDWLNAVAQDRPELKQAGYFGSYARGDWGVGSDLDLIIVVDESGLDFFQRAIDWDVTSLPVPVDVLVYTEDEWKRMGEREDLFYLRIQKEAVWIFSR